MKYFKLQDLRAGRPLLGAALLLLASVQNAQAQTTFYVDDDAPGDPGPSNPFISDPAENGSIANPFDTLREALDLTVSGDTVLVQPGTYFELATIQMSGQVGPFPAPAKALTIKSTAGPEFTFLEGSQLIGSSSPQIVRCAQGEGAGMVFDGFTLRGADSGSLSSSVGAGLFISNSSPTIKNCWFQNNHAYLGAGLFISNSTSLVQDCRFEFNDSVHQGGAVYTNNGMSVFEKCTFEGNTANFGGAFLSRTGTSTGITVRDSLFYNNASLNTYAGAFAKFDGGFCSVERSLFVGNTSADESSAIHISGGGTVSDCILNGNISNGNKGAINATGGGTLNLLNSTVTENIGGGVREQTGGQTVVLNSILYNNQAYEFGAGVAISYSNVLGGAPGSGNIDLNPRFVNARGADLLPGTLDDDLRLRRSSPCIDAGDTSGFSNSYPLDFNGKARVIDQAHISDSGVALVGYTVDMGAHELQPRVAQNSPF